MPAGRPPKYKTPKEMQNIDLNELVVGEIKPNLKKSNGFWKCMSENSQSVASGRGYTPEEAFYKWFFCPDTYWK